MANPKSVVSESTGQQIKMGMSLGAVCSSLPLPVATCVQPRIVPSRKTASLVERLSASKFPYRHPVLYGSLLELRNFLHRIQSLRKRGDIRPLEIGSLYQQSSETQRLQLNTGTQARSKGIRKLLSVFPYLTTEDCRLYLAGWDAAEEWRAGLDNEESSEDGQDSYPLRIVL